MILRALVMTCVSIFVLAANVPSDDEIAAALASAREAWKATQEITVRSEPLNNCELRDIPHIAEMQWEDVQTTVTFDGQSTVSHKLTYVVLLNSNCDWSKLSLSQTMLHEVGHVVIGAEWHNPDRRSIMYYIVSGKQVITPEDRAMVRENREVSLGR